MGNLKLYRTRYLVHFLPQKTFPNSDRHCVCTLGNRLYVIAPDAITVTFCPLSRTPNYNAWPTTWCLTKTVPALQQHRSHAGVRVLAPREVAKLFLILPNKVSDKDLTHNRPRTVAKKYCPRLLLLPPTTSASQGFVTFQFANLTFATDRR